MEIEKVYVEGANGPNTVNSGPPFHRPSKAAGRAKPDAATDPTAKVDIRGIENACSIVFVSNHLKYI